MEIIALRGILCPLGVLRVHVVHCKLLPTKWHKMHAYMDDFGFFLRPEDAEWQRDFILQTFEDLGLLLNDKKSQFHKRGGPFTQRLKLLGFWIDTSEDKFICDPDRIAGAKSLARERSARTRVSARDLSRFLGKMQSLGLCLGKWVRLYTRHLYDAVESSVESREGGWNSLVDISSTECKRELSLLSKGLDLHRKSIQPLEQANA